MSRPAVPTAKTMFSNKEILIKIRQPSAKENAERKRAAIIKQQL
jgi:hypothetical protein